MCVCVKTFTEADLQAARVHVNAIEPITQNYMAKQRLVGFYMIHGRCAFMNLCDKHNLLKTLNHFFPHNQKLIKPKNMVRIFIHFVVFSVQAVSETALSNILVDYNKIFILVSTNFRVDSSSYCFIDTL